MEIVHLGAPLTQKQFWLTREGQTELEIRLCAPLTYVRHIITIVDQAKLQARRPIPLERVEQTKLASRL